MNKHIRSRLFGGSVPTIALMLAAGTMISTSPIAHAQHPIQTGSSLYVQPPLDGLALGMAYSRMNGTTPDFRPAAERSGAYLNATTFDRPAVLTREIARLEGAFRTFDLDRVYSMRIGVNVEQYVDSDDAARVFRACSAHRSDLMPPTIPI